MAEQYKDKDRGIKVWAYQVPSGCTDEVTTYDGETIVAHEGDWLITSPYQDVVDPESFELDYERV